MLKTIIITVVMILALISCKNQPTSAATISEGEKTTENSTIDFNQFIGKFFRSEKAISPDGILGYLWVQITETELKYSQGDALLADAQKYTTFLSKSYTLNKNVLQNNVGNFLGYDDQGNPQQGTVTFNSDGSLVLRFSIGTSYNGQDIITLKIAD